MRSENHSTFRAPHSALGRGRTERAGEGIRTPDPLITNQMLYRLSYASPHKPKIIPRWVPNHKGALGSDADTEPSQAG